jgi:NAD(P)-dependent dehydrogenase (short-subunit alcohol dehydrogenase family)
LKLFLEVHKKFGNIDILINNAHSAKGSSQENMSDEDWNYTMEGVVGSTHKSIRTVIPYMQQQKDGKIINILIVWNCKPDFESLYAVNIAKNTPTATLWCCKSCYDPAY